MKLHKGGQRLIVSQNTAPGAPGVFQPGHSGRLVEIPAGQRQGTALSPERHFLKSTVPVPGRVFDAKRDVGAKGDGTNDDTAALQQAIDAARTHGQGAIAYVTKDEPAKGTAMEVHDYAGQVFFGHSQFYCEPTEVRILHSGTAPFDLYILATCFYSTRPAVQADASAHFWLIGNEAVGTIEGDAIAKGSFDAADTLPQAQWGALSAALDDLRRLGETDLRLNHWRGSLRRRAARRSCVVRCRRSRAASAPTAPCRSSPACRSRRARCCCSCW